ncbi:MAG: hypothetical protein KGK16_02690, partial [Bradyrhizobium sp.]|nr:hypothetical protein [Bradyrhizobium sp.]
RPPGGRGMRGNVLLICPTSQAKYFFVNEWTVDSALIGLMKLDFWRSGLVGSSEASGSVQSVIPERCEVNELWYAAVHPGTHRAA